jgi:WD40 repeat protein
LASYSGHESAIRALTYDPLGRTLISGSADQTIRLWYPNQQMDSITLKGHTGTVRALAFANMTLASASDDGTVKLWPPAAGKFWKPHPAKEPITLKGHAGEVCYLVASGKVIGPEAGRVPTILVSGGQDGSIILWDPVSAQMRASLKGHKDAVTALALHPQGRDLISGGLDAALLRWQNAKNQTNMPPRFAAPPMVTATNNGFQPDEDRRPEKVAR